MQASQGDAFKAALGLNKGYIPIDIWKALPWSWLIDWSLDISQTLQANYNMIYYTATNCCRMDYSSNTYSHGDYPSIHNHWLSSGTFTYEVKARKVLIIPPNLTPTLKLPFLDNFKLSVLGSLAILKISGSAKRTLRS
jgi:hypothetical protein